MNRYYEQLLYFVNTLHLEIDVIYDEEEQSMEVSKENWFEKIFIMKKDIREIQIQIGNKNQSYCIDNEVDIKDIILWMYFHIVKHEQKSKIYHFMGFIEEYYSNKGINIKRDDENQRIQIEELLLRIDESGNIIYDNGNETISNISYDMYETIEWIDMNVLSEVSLD